MNIRNLIILGVLISTPILKIWILKLFAVMDDFLDYDHYATQRQKYTDPFREELREERYYAAENYKSTLRDMLRNGDYRRYIELHRAACEWDYILVYNTILDYYGDIDGQITIIDGKVQRPQNEDEGTISHFRNNIEEYISGR